MGSRFCHLCWIYADGFFLAFKGETSLVCAACSLPTCCVARGALAVSFRLKPLLYETRLECGIELNAHRGTKPPWVLIHPMPSPAQHHSAPWGASMVLWESSLHGPTQRPFTLYLHAASICPASLLLHGSLCDAPGLGQTPNTTVQRLFTELRSQQDRGQPAHKGRNLCSKRR